MNWLVLIAGLLSAAGWIAHLTVGRSRVLSLLGQASSDPTTKRVMICQYLYVAGFGTLSTIMMLLIGFQIWHGFVAVLYFIALNFIAFAIVQVFVAVGSGSAKELLKLNHWIGFIIVAVLLLAGA